MAWDDRRVPPNGGRTAAIVSLLLWTVTLCGLFGVGGLLGFGLPMLW